MSIAMSIDLSTDSEAFLSDAVSRGLFPSRIEALEVAVDLLRQRQSLVARLAESRRQLDEGEYVEFDDEGIRDFFDRLLPSAVERARGR
jgi:Arc/MetJ-type ribon-helix-helix transcriptional regulator